MSIRTQMRKGFLDACILSIIQSQPVYGYELSKKLNEYNFTEVSEGTIYPILLRLLNKEFIYSEFKVSEQGPKRKYYYITDKGREELKLVIQEWDKIKKPIQDLLKDV
ncbi:PadR family transcriptional regulator [Mammaliicoccus stepanovicii]|uniref:Transcriptional regulator n=1 Tax=Mammaliicoccus stepanovicii TaxID=643214 RepID=A0A240A228_9STAP|nr:PadR family transcriptional regulator [Mammaliicoccus stepanovicii]PNZ71979.1 PadR family transcriptional regulator [Mammaliicoccus stepanovicii]GGI39323.1 PadR family transcriptional regulator [Mammaliicoccus stepanovicii]SNV77038.1 transcriptional regulator [Mammaliicoccus stepanovicii]